MIIALWRGVSFALAGNIISVAVTALFGFAALGLWFQSRLAAWALIVFAAAGIIVALSKFGHAPVLRIVTPIIWALCAIALLIEYLGGEGTNS